MLRDYQSEDLGALRIAMRGGAKRILFEASVGYGKSVIIETLAEKYSGAGKLVWVFSNRSAVVNQLAKRAAHLPGVSVMTVQAADRRRDKLALCPAHIILVDEAHMGGSAEQYQRVLDCAPGGVVVAFTGTPKPDLFDVFPCHVQGKGARWLTDNGFLSPLKYVCPNPLDMRGIKITNGEYDDAQVLELLEKRKIFSKTIDTYRAYGLGVPTLGFCVNVKHATDTAEQFRNAGHNCEVLTGKDKDKDVERKIDSLKDGGLIFSVDKVSAGFDLPDLRVLLHMRPTKSEQLWVQQLGRAARASDGKTHGLVLDHVGNTLRLGTLTEERNWRGDEPTVRAQRQTESGEKLSIRQCQGCMAVFEAGPSACPYCEHTLAKETRIPLAEHVRLKEIEAAEIEAARARAKEERKRMGQTIAQMAAWLGSSMGYRRGYKKAVENMKSRYERAQREGDEALVKFAHDELKKNGAI